MLLPKFSSKTQYLCPLSKHPMQQTYSILSGGKVMTFFNQGPPSQTKQRHNPWGNSSIHSVVARFVFSLAGDALFILI